MSTQIRIWHSLALMSLALAAAVVLIFLPLAVQAQGTPDPCTVITNYDQAQAAADAAEEASKKLVEPDWNKLPGSLRSEFTPHILVEAPGEPVREKRVQNLLRELKFNLQALKKSLGSGELTLQDYNDAEKYLNSLQRLLANQKTDIEAFDKDPSMPQGEAQKWMKVIDDSEYKITQFVGNREIAVAKWRPSDPTFNDFNSPEITQKRLALDEAKGVEAKQKAELALNQAVEQARQEAKKAVATLNQATEALVKLGWVSEEGEKLVRQKSHMQRELTKLEADIKKQEKKLEDIDEAVKISAAIGEIEPWLNIRLKRVQTQEKLKQAKGDYDKAIKAKDAALDRAKAELKEVQARINRTRMSLKGQAKDQAYYQKLSQMILYARVKYELILLSLVDLDCFGGVRKFMDDLKQRMKKLDEARDQILKEASGIKPAKPTPARGTFGRIGVVLGTVPGPSENNDARAYGSISATSYSVTVEAKFYEGKTTVKHTYNTPPATLKPGDIIELKCASTATISGGKNKNGALNAPFIGSSCGWDIQGKVERLKAFKRVDTETEKGKVIEEYKGTFAGIASNGIFYPSSAISVRLKVLPGTKGDTITLQAWQSGQTWGRAEEKPTWNPAEYKYKFNP